LNGLAMVYEFLGRSTSATLLDLNKRSVVAGRKLL
jgi:hypothetical protein